MWETHIIFGTVHSDRNVAVLLHKHFSLWFSMFAILSVLSWIVHILTWANLTIQHISTIHSPFSRSLVTSNFSSVLLVSRWFFTWITLGDVDLLFWLIWLPKANVLKGELHHPCDYIANIINPHTWLMA